MLRLKSITSPTWVTEVEEHLEEVLLDHAHCEKKAAGAAMSLLFAYQTDADLVRELSSIIKEELDHLEQALDLLERRGLRMRSQQQSSYGARLRTLIRKEEPWKAVDRCLVAALIEARSCERFQLLRDHLRDRELAAFYGSLMESEARHHTVFIRLAERFADRQTVQTRLEELAVQEARILARGDPYVRLHS